MGSGRSESARQITRRSEVQAPPRRNVFTPGNFIFHRGGRGNLRVSLGKLVRLQRTLFLQW